MSSRGVIDCTIFHGFSMTDVPGVGVSVLAIADGDEAVARSSTRSVHNAAETDAVGVMHEPVHDGLAIRGLAQALVERLDAKLAGDYDRAPLSAVFDDVEHRGAEPVWVLR